jgi:exodeoxyribonuclease-3
MKVATFNVNSIRARLPLILEWLKKEIPDLLLLQETKVQDKDFPAGAFESAGFRAVYKGQKAYNGVAIISRSPVEQLRPYLAREQEEARFLSAVVDGVSVINVYVPQGVAPGTEKFQVKLQWLRDGLAHIREHYTPQSPLLLAGDFNVALESRDVYDPEGLRGAVGFHPEEQALLQQWLDWGLVDVFRQHCQEGGHYTFWDYRIPNALKRKMGWRIDYVLATRPLASRSLTSWIDTGPRLSEKPSDHTFMVAEFDLSKQ